MKKILLMALLLTMFLGMHAQTGMRMLITYFSWSGSTKNLAEEIQRQILLIAKYSYRCAPCRGLPMYLVSTA